MADGRIERKDVISPEVHEGLKELEKDLRTNTELLEKLTVTAIKLNKTTVDSTKEKIRLERESQKTLEASYKAQTQQQKLVEQTTKAQIAQQTAQQKAQIAQQKLIEQTTKAQIAQQKATEQAAAASSKQAAEAARASSKQAAEASKAFNTMHAEALKMNKAFDKAFNTMHAEALKMNKAFDKASKSTSSWGDALSSLGFKFNTLGNLAGQLVGGIFRNLGSSIMDMANKIYDQTKRIDSLNMSYKAIFPTTEEFNKAMQSLTKTSNQTGASILQLKEQYLQFAAASKGTSLEGKASLDIFNSVSKSLAVMGINGQQADQAFLALSQMMSKGTVQSEELKKQLGNALPGAFKIMADAMQVPVSSLQKMMEKGEVLAVEALPKFAKALEKAYGTESVSRINTLAAAEGRYQTALTNFIDKFQASGFLTSITNAKTAMVEFFTGNYEADKLEQNFRTSSTELSKQIIMLNNHNVPLEKRKLLYEQLQLQYPAYLQNTTYEEQNYGKITTALLSVNNGLIDKLVLERQNLKLTEQANKVADIRLEAADKESTSLEYLATLRKGDNIEVDRSRVVVTQLREALTKVKQAHEEEAKNNALGIMTDRYKEQIGIIGGLEMRISQLTDVYKESRIEQGIYDTMQKKQIEDANKLNTSIAGQNDAIKALIGRKQEDAKKEEEAAKKKEEDAKKEEAAKKKAEDDASDRFKLEKQAYLDKIELQKLYLDDVNQMIQNGETLTEAEKKYFQEQYSYAIQSIEVAKLEIISMADKIKLIKAIEDAYRKANAAQSGDSSKDRSQLLKEEIKAQTEAVRLGEYQVEQSAEYLLNQKNIFGVNTEKANLLLAEIEEQRGLIEMTDIDADKKERHTQKMILLQSRLSDLTKKSVKDSMEYTMEMISLANTTVENVFKISENLMERDKQKQLENIDAVYQQRLKAGMDEVAADKLRAEEKDKIAKEFAVREARMKRKQAIWEKANATAQLAYQTAIATMAALKEPFWIAAAKLLLIGASAITGAAVIASTPLPEIPEYWKGTENHVGGLAVVGDRFGAERVTLPNGDMFITPNKATLMDLPKGTKVDTHDSLMRMMTQLQGKDGKKVTSAGIEAELLKELISTVANKKETHINLDERGLTTFTQSKNSRVKYVNAIYRS